MKTVLVTGANGFIGRPLCARLVEQGWDVVAALRGAPAPPELKGCTICRTAGVDSEEGWASILKGINVVVHLAARVHVMNHERADSLEQYRRVNTLGTLRLARLAAGRGAARFVFLSTVKVNGEHSAENPFTEADPAAPVDSYARSKWEAEQGLAEIAATTAMQVVAVRPPLVYGPGVKGNFLRLMGLVHRRFPLPLASVANLRSFAYVGNLVSALESMLTATLPRAATFLVSDDHDLSTPELVRSIGAAMSVSPRLLPCPPWLLLAAGRLIGKREEMQRMIESLRLDCSRIKRELHWRPPFSTTDGIADAVAWFLRAGASSGTAPG